MLFTSENRFVHARHAPKVLYVWRQLTEKPVLVSTRAQQTLPGSLKFISIQRDSNCDI